MTDVFDEVYGEEEKADAVQIAEETMLGDLTRAMLDEFKAAPDVWQKLSEDKQGEVIERLERRVADCVEQVVHIIASADRATIRARLEQLTTKDAVKALCIVSRKDRGAHDLLDSVGEEVLLVLPHAEQYTEQTTGIEPDPDQADLALADDDNVDPLLTDALQTVRAAGRCTISLVQKELKIGYNRAAHLVELMERQGLVSATHGDGIRQVNAEEVDKAITGDDPHFYDALEVLEHVGQCSADILASEIAVDEEAAALTLEALERCGLVGEANADGIREVITERVDALIDSRNGRGGGHA